LQRRSKERVETTPKVGKGMYLDETGRRYWVTRNDLGALLFEDENGALTVISASHPALSNKLLQSFAELDRCSK
jgi:hypothetical protein